MASDIDGIQNAPSPDRYGTIRHNIELNPPQDVEFLLTPDVSFLVENAEWIEVRAPCGKIETIRAVSVAMSREEAVDRYSSYEQSTGLAVADADQLQQWKQSMAKGGGHSLHGSRDLPSEYINLDVEIFYAPSFGVNKNWRIIGTVYYVPERHRERFLERIEQRQRTQ